MTRRRTRACLCSSWGIPWGRSWPRSRLRNACDTLPSALGSRSWCFQASHRDLRRGHQSARSRSRLRSSQGRTLFGNECETAKNKFSFEAINPEALLFDCLFFFSLCVILLVFVHGFCGSQNETKEITNVVRSLGFSVRKATAKTLEFAQDRVRSFFQRSLIFSTTARVLKVGHASHFRKALSARSYFRKHLKVRYWQTFPFRKKNRALKNFRTPAVRTQRSLRHAADARYHTGCNTDCRGNTFLPFFSDGRASQLKNRPVSLKCIRVILNYLFYEL